MAQDSSNKLTRLELSYLDGVNSIMSSNVAKKEEMMHAENVRSPLVGTADKREGQETIGTLVATNNYGIFYYFNETDGNQNLFRISKVSGVTKIYYLNDSLQWTAINVPLATIANEPEDFFDTALAEGDLYITDINNNNRYISEDVVGTLTMYDSTTAGVISRYSNLYNSPKANLVNYYKDRLYLADYITNDGVRQQNSVLFSSTPLGIISLVYQDVAQDVNEVPVTFSKYFIAGEVIEVYRGNNIVTVFTVDSVNSESIIRNHNIPNYLDAVPLEAADELWVFSTYKGKRIFRWPQTIIREGVNTKEYDTLKLTGTQGNDSEQITMMENVGNVMILASSNNIATWNNFVLQNLDLGIGCVSKRSYVKCSGSLFFLHYTGVFMTAGDMPKIVSNKIERYLFGATKSGLENSCAGKKGRSVFFAIGDVTLYQPDGSFEKILPDVCLEYNLTQDNWYPHTNVKADMMTTWINETDFDSLVTLNRSTDKPVVEFLKKDVYIDIDQEIEYRFDTKNIMLGGTFEKIAYPQELCIEMERGSGLKAFVSLDMGDWYELPGECAKGATILKLTRKNSDVAMPVRCRNMRVSLRHGYKQSCKVSKLSITYLPTNEEDVQKPDYAS